MGKVTTSGARLRYQEYDRIPEDVPALGVEMGDEGVIRSLHLDNETVLAFVVVSYSTRQGMDKPGDQTSEQGPFLHDLDAIVGTPP